MTEQERRTKPAHPPSEFANLASWTLDQRQLCDLEMLLDGSFAPLAGYMDQEDHERVCREMRLAGGRVWPIPVALDVPEDFAKRVERGATIALRDQDGTVLALLKVGSVWQPDLKQEARLVFGTESDAHPGVRSFLSPNRPFRIGGAIEGVKQVVHYDHSALRQPPHAVKAEFARLGWDRVVGFQTRNPLHRAHYELTRWAMESVGGALLIQPAVGTTMAGDIDHHTRVRTYEAILPAYPRGRVMLRLLPLAMRMAGPREALWHAIVRKNYGCTHFIVGRDHAGPGNDRDGKPFYDPMAAQRLATEHADEIGIKIVGAKEFMYVEEARSYLPADRVPAGAQTRNISGTSLRKMLADGVPVPEWFTFPAVAAELARSYPPRWERGLTLFFTGLSGAGKSTIARALLARLEERLHREVTMLDGDHVRQALSSELGFSREHRDLNIRRIGYVAAEITKHRGIAICAPIAPYASTRREVRRYVEETGTFVLIHVSTPLEICEARDSKGLYARARAGKIPTFTGVSDPYEVPEDAELVIDSSVVEVGAAVDRIFAYLTEKQLLPPATKAG